MWLPDPHATWQADKLLPPFTICLLRPSHVSLQNDPIQPVTHEGKYSQSLCTLGNAVRHTCVPIRRNPVRRSGRTRQSSIRRDLAGRNKQYTWTTDTGPFRRTTARTSSKPSSWNTSHFYRGRTNRVRAHAPAVREVPRGRDVARNCKILEAVQRVNEKALRRILRGSSLTFV